MKKNLWITYAWEDNKDQSFDFVVQELERRGLNVIVDRGVTIAGLSLWERIFAAIDDDSLDAWSIYLTRASLQSPACREELDSALSRALRKGRDNFPLIGILPEPVENDLIPAPLRNRKYVLLTQQNAFSEIVDGVSRQNTFKRDPIEPIGAKIRDDGLIEFWPMIGTLTSISITYTGNFTSMGSRLSALCPFVGPRGNPNLNIRSRKGVEAQQSEKLTTIRCQDTVLYGQSAFAYIMPGAKSAIVGGIDATGNEIKREVVFRHH